MFILQAARRICRNGSPIRDCNQAFERIQHEDDLKNFSEFAQGFAIARAQIYRACLPRLPDTNLTLNRTVKAVAVGGQCLFQQAIGNQCLA